MEDDVRRLLEGRHVRVRGSTSDVTGGHGDSSREDGRHEDEMDVDELDPDCISSYNPSRAASPAPTGPSSSSAPSGSRFDAVRHAGLLARRESSSPYNSLGRRGSSQALRRHQRRTGADAEVELDQDLAGTCFDPSGEYIYVGATGGVAEWKVRGAEQRWWSEASWA